MRKQITAEHKQAMLRGREAKDNAVLLSLVKKKTLQIDFTYDDFNYILIINNKKKYFSNFAYLFTLLFDALSKRKLKEKMITDFNEIKEVFIEAKNEVIELGKQIDKVMKETHD